MTMTTESLTTMNASNSTTDELAPHLVRIQEADQYMTYVIIILIMIGMGGATEISELKKCLRRPWGILICWFSQFVVMPLVAFGVAHAVNLKAEYAIGLIVQCSSPGGSMSNVFAFYAKGNVSLSVTLTTCSTILAVGAMPLALFLYGRSWTQSASFDIPYLTVILSLVMILVPAAIGLFLKYKLPKYIDRISNVCALVGTIGLLIGIILRAIVKPDVYTSDWYLWLISGSLPMIAGIVGFVCSSIFRLPCSSRRTISIETTCQNVALALTVINTSFPAGNQRAEMLVLSSLLGPIMAIEVIVIIAVYRAFYKCGHCRVCDYGDETEDDNVEMVERYINKDGESGISNNNVSELDSKKPKSDVTVENSDMKPKGSDGVNGQTNYAYQ
ncbi:sodium-dependent organic anion transporter-like [Glandiceps talaboti]